ncbi:hypothetical protein FIU94_15400 [Sulfitobacter sp. THAF37]|uniref:hypothetical protein n=1 Tax=Sulfitobacter sp. THAF37 TaxID=2587855 RepID=UPI0012A96D9A|nr:hypothetical protein [Sulfitobacter sp. THAF37]QFT60212.1 hypothetical protein FIU94_15400 [Sulfitobacter sp. THAF37]
MSVAYLTLSGLTGILVFVSWLIIGGSLGGAALGYVLTGNLTMAALAARMAKVRQS